jgi:hypothetical protein
MKSILFKTLFILLPILSYGQATLIDKSQISASGASTNQILKWNGTAWVFANDENSGSISGTGTSGQIAFWNGATSLTGSNNLFWNNTDARLGLGLTNPTERLDVVGSIKLSGGLKIPQAAAIEFGTTWNTGTISFNNGPTTAIVFDVPNGRIRNNLGSYLTASSAIGRFGTFDNYATTFVTNNVERARIDISGNLLVGTTSAAGRLTVMGADNSTSTTNALFESNNGTDILKITNAGIITMPTTGNAGTDTDRFMVLTSSSEVAQRTGDQVLQDIGVPTYVASRGENLITNGSGLMGNNYNFTGLTFDASDTYYASGSFKTPTTQGSFFVSEFIPVDATKTYRGTVFAKLNPYVAGNLSYFGVVAYDVDGYSIGPFNHMYQANTLTTLAQPLNVGDTIMYLTSAANWNNTAAGTALRSIIFWDYANLGGYVYPELTYSRNWLDNAYNIGQINYTTNTIRLRVPWAGPVKPAGTKLSNGNSGGTYKYFIASAVNVPNTWTQYTGVLDGVDLSGTNVTNKFPPGTARIKLMYLYNYGTAGGVLWTSNISFGLDNPTGAGTTNYIPKFTSSTTLGNSQIFDNGTNIGIGTTTPSYKLDVTSDIRVNNRIIGEGVGSDVSNTFIIGNINSSFSGTHTTAIGSSNLSGITTASGNTLIGSGAGGSITTGGSNTYIGRDVSGNNQSSASNTSIGAFSLLNHTTGDANIAIGQNAGRYISGGVTNATSINTSIFIGNNSYPLGNSQGNQIVIGFQSVGLGNNTTRIGNSSTNQTHLDGRLTIGNTLYDANVTTRISGLSNTNSTYALWVTNSDGGTSTAIAPAFVVRNDGNVGIGVKDPNSPLHIVSSNPMRSEGGYRAGSQSTTAPFFFPFTTSPGSPVTTGTNLSFFNYTASSAATEGAFTFGGSPFTQTASTQYFFRFRHSFEPTSGNAGYVAFSVRPTINQIGGANGQTVGMFIDPVLTNAADWKSILWNNDTGFGLYGSGAAKNYLAGALGIGTTSPAATSILDITSTTKGILIPRMTLAQRDAITSPATGLQIYNTDSNVFQYYNGTSWTNVGGTGVTDLTFSGSSSPVTLNSSTGADVTFVAGTNVSLSQSSNQLTINSSEVDGSISNEGTLGVSAGAANTSVITSNTSGATGVTIQASTGLSISETTSSNGGTIVLTNSSPDQTVSLTGAGISNVTGTYPNFTITSTEVDGSTTNEIQNLSLSGQSLGISSGTGVTLPVVGITAGTGISTSSTSGNFTITNTAPNVTTNLSFDNSSSPVTLNSSDGTDVTFTAGTNVNFSQAGNNLTINSTAMSNPMTTLGDIIYGGASGAPTRLAGNTIAQRKFLTQTGTGSVSAAPEWYFFDESAYVNKYGESNGQVIYGGNAANTNIYLESNSTTSRGAVYLNYVGGDIRLGGGSGNPNLLKFYEKNSLPNLSDSNFVAFKAPNVLSANTTYTLPTADGTSNQVLTTNGSGSLSWSTISTGISGATGRLPYYNTSTSLDTTGMYWSVGNKAIGINFPNPAATLQIKGTSNSASTYSLYVSSNDGSKTLNFDNSGKVGINVAFPSTTLSFNGSMSRKAPVKTGISSTYTVLETDSWVICNGTSNITLTLPAATDFRGREIMVKNVSAISVSSASSNIIAIPATAGKWATLVSTEAQNGNWYWVIMQSN